MKSMTPDAALTFYLASENGAIFVCHVDFRNGLDRYVLVQMNYERHLFAGNYVLCQHVCKIGDHKI